MDDVNTTAQKTLYTDICFQLCGIVGEGPLLKSWLNELGVEGLQ